MKQIETENKRLPHFQLMSPLNKYDVKVAVTKKTKHDENGAESGLKKSRRWTMDTDTHLENVTTC